jgi:hypothetical protein
MRRLFILGAVAALGGAAFSSATLSAAATAVQDKQDKGTPNPAASLAGTWRSEPDELKLTSAFDKSVWGPDATAVRSVELTVRPTGEARLVVTRRVTDGRGRTIAASTSIEEADIVIGAATESSAGRREHDVRVVKAVRRYPDDPPASWDLAGLGVKVVTFADGDPNMLEVRLDTPEGRGSFWETLRRTGSGSKRSS